MIKSIFFAHFNPTAGPQVVHQVPPGSITSNVQDGLTEPLFDFDLVSEFIIPKQTLCDRLISFVANRHRIIGYPVRLSDRGSERKYQRNEYIFNFVIVLDEATDVSSYQAVVRKIARLFRALEVESGFLWREASTQSVFALIEQIMEDLNNYCECMIPIDDSNSINLKLFPKYPPPPSVKPYHVPICAVQLHKIMDENWDLTMQRIIRYIDGINTVSRISQLADTDYTLTKKCIEHLLYYHCVILSPMILFNSIWAPTPELGTLLVDENTQREALSYIPLAPSTRNVSISDLFTMYASLRQGQTLKEWYTEKEIWRKGIDIRRFVSFGSIRGLVYRVQKWPVTANLRSLDDERTDLGKFLEGARMMDEVCEELRVGEAKALDMLIHASNDELLLIHK